MRTFSKYSLVLSVCFTLAMLMQSLMLVHIHNDDHAQNHAQCDVLSKVNWLAPLVEITLNPQPHYKHGQKIQAVVSQCANATIQHCYFSRAPPAIS